MSIEKMYAVIEAVLFTMGESVETAKLAAAIEQDVSTTVKLIHNLMDRYEAEDRGIKIIELGDSFQLCTKPETEGFRSWSWNMPISSALKKRCMNI